MRGIFFYVSFLPFLISAQVRGVILDAENGHPVSFASISWDEGNGIIAAYDGKFELPTTFSREFIHLSCIGYQSDTILVRDQFLTVKLIPKAIQLSPLVIAHGRIILERLGADKKNTSSSFGAIEGFQVANYIPHPDPSKKYHVKNILYSVKGGISGAEETKPKNSFFRARIYELGGDGLPGKDLLEGNLVITPDSNKGWISVDISRYGLVMPTKGFFVAMEWIEGTPSAVWKPHVDGVKTKMVDYGHSIRMHEPLDQGVKFWTYVKGKSKEGFERTWRDYNATVPDNWPIKGKVAGIAIEVFEL